MSLGLMARTIDLEMLQSVSFCRWDLGVSGGLRWLAWKTNCRSLARRDNWRWWAISRVSAVRLLRPLGDLSASAASPWWEAPYVVGVW